MSFLLDASSRASACFQAPLRRCRLNAGPSASGRQNVIFERQEIRWWLYLPIQDVAEKCAANLAGSGVPVVGAG
jgi:hypothetical protein